MAKILAFSRSKKERVEVETAATTTLVAAAVAEDEISAVLNDYSLSPSNRRWILENMLMNIDDQLEAYKKELEKAESKLDALVQTAEQEIALAYREFETQVRGMTYAVRKLTGTSAHDGESNATAGGSANRPDSSD